MLDFTIDTANRKNRVLVADDVDISRKMICTLLKKDGYDTIEARNGLEVVQMLKSAPEQLDCIILDVMMPVMDGIKVMQFMKENDLLDTIPVAAFTAISDADSKILCYEAGAIDIIEKPIDNKLLLYKVRHMIEMFRKRRESSSNVGSEKLDYVQSVLDSLPIGIFVRDAATRRIKYSNATFHLFPGCPDDLEGTTLESFIPRSMLEPIEGAAEDLLVRRVQTPVEIDDGAGNHFTVVFNALQDENGVITDLIGALINTTAEAEVRHRLEEQLRVFSTGR